MFSTALDFILQNLKNDQYFALFNIQPQDYNVY